MKKLLKSYEKSVKKSQKISRKIHSHQNLLLSHMNGQYNSIKTNTASSSDMNNSEKCFATKVPSEDLLTDQNFKSSSNFISLGNVVYKKNCFDYKPRSILLNENSECEEFRDLMVIGDIYGRFYWWSLTSQNQIESIKEPLLKQHNYKRLLESMSWNTRGDILALAFSSSNEESFPNLYIARPILKVIIII